MSNVDYKQVSTGALGGGGLVALLLAFMQQQGVHKVDQSYLQQQGVIVEQIKGLTEDYKKIERSNQDLKDKMDTLQFSVITAGQSRWTKEDHDRYVLIKQTQDQEENKKLQERLFKIENDIRLLKKEGP